jgi:hypothetical protein
MISVRQLRVARGLEWTGIAGRAGEIGDGQWDEVKGHGITDSV